MLGYANTLWKEREYEKFMETNKIMVVGYIRSANTQSEHIRFEDYVYSEEGVAPTLTARDWKDPRRILINKEIHNNG